MPESYDLGALKVLAESGKLSADSLTTMLVRKADWHDFEGIKYLLKRGERPQSHDPLGFHRTASSPAAQQFARDHRGALRPRSRPGSFDPRNRPDAASIAARKGRGDVLAALDRRGIGSSFLELSG